MSQDLGPCCACGGRTLVRNIMMLNRRAPVPGTGWGCVVCGLPSDGAAAVLCDNCFKAGRKFCMIIHGYPTSCGRIAEDQYPVEPFDHDHSKHPELQKVLT